MELSYRQLEATLVAHLRINPDRISTFRSRVKQLQRLEFPKGVNVGRGTKMIYTGEHLMKLAFAFELLARGMTAQLATTLVERHWEELSVSVSIVVRNRLRWWFDKNIYARILLRGLEDMQHPLPGVPTSQVFVEDQDALSNILGRDSRRIAHGYTVLCVTDLSLRVWEFAEALAGQQNAIYDPEFVGWLPSSHPSFLVFAGEYRKSSPEKAISELTRTMSLKEAEVVVEQLEAIDRASSEHKGADYGD